MDLEEYKAWLKEHGNKEEKKAFEVANEVITYHAIQSDVYSASFFPREIFKTNKERIEYDLIIRLNWVTGGKEYKRVIGIEFKEYDFSKVVQQAISRKTFVDYQYIATRPVIPNKCDLFRLFDFGIGWVLWTDKITELIIPARKNDSWGITSLIEYIAKREVDEILGKSISKHVSLNDYGL